MYETGINILIYFCHNRQVERSRSLENYASVVIKISSEKCTRQMAEDDGEKKFTQKLPQRIRHT